MGTDQSASLYGEGIKELTSILSKTSKTLGDGIKRFLKKKDKFPKNLDIGNNLRFYLQNFFNMPSNLDINGILNISSLNIALAQKFSYFSCYFSGCYSCIDFSI